MGRTNRVNLQETIRSLSTAAAIEAECCFRSGVDQIIVVSSVTRSCSYGECCTQVRLLFRNVRFTHYREAVLYSVNTAVFQVKLRLDAVDYLIGNELD